MNRKFLLVLIAASVGALALSGLGCEMCCNSSQGQGSIVINDQAVTRGHAVGRARAAATSQASNEPHKATFSYRVECVGSYDPASTRTVTGRLQFQDNRLWQNAAGRLLNVNIHGAVNDVLASDERAVPAYNAGEIATDDYCSVQKPGVAMFKGRYRPQPAAAGDGGDFNIIVEDKGSPGPSSEDTFEIRLIGGVFDGYAVSGVLAGGNVKPL